MDVRDRALYHQIHPAKLATDISTAVASLWLLWQRHLAIALVVMFVPPVVGSALLVAPGHPDGIAASRFGRRMHRMTPAMMALRLLGMLVMSIGAWRQERLPLACGAALMASAWVWVMR